MPASFEGYDAAFDMPLGGSQDIGPRTEAFADCFIAGNPEGVACGKNDHLRDVIAQEYRFYKSMGTKEVNIDSMDINLLDKYQSLVKGVLPVALRGSQMLGGVCRLQHHIPHPGHG